MQAPFWDRVRLGNGINIGRVSTDNVDDPLESDEAGSWISTDAYRVRADKSGICEYLIASKCTVPAIYTTRVK